MSSEVWTQIHKPRRGSSGRGRLGKLALPRRKELDKLIRLVELADLDDDALVHALDIGGRDLTYYRRNAKILGLLDADNVPTPAGRVLEQLTIDEKIMRLAHAFETSDVGRAWLAWASVQRLDQLDPVQAEAFVEYVRLLRGAPMSSTWPVYATTLRSWCEQFQRHVGQGVRPERRSNRRRPPIAAIGTRAAAFDRATTLEIIQAMARGASNVEVATGYFSLHGYHDLMASLERADLRVLVGTHDQARDQVHDQVYQFLRVFALSLAPDLDLGLESLATIARDLHRQIVRGRVEVRHFEPREQDHLHAKLFIFDRVRAYVTSSNLTRGGLRTNIESGVQVLDAAEAGHLHDRFAHYFEAARPLNEAILAQLERSSALWGLADPQLVVLAVLDALFGHLRTISPGRFQLAEFQKAIVATVLARYQSRRRLLLIAPTGIGKTIIAAHVAKLLREAGEVERVILACKNASIGAMWRDALRSLGLAGERVRVYELEYGDEDLDTLIRSSSERDFIIVDDCDQFRQQAGDRLPSLDSLLGGPGVADSPRALLMTATPIRTGFEDVQALAKLVDDDSVETIADVATAPGIVNIALGPILRDFGQPDGRYVGLSFADQLRYFPHLDVRSVRYASSMIGVFGALKHMEFPLARRAQDYAGLDLDDALIESQGRHGVIRCLLARLAESSPHAFRTAISTLLASVEAGRLIPRHRKKFVDQLHELEVYLERLPARDAKLDALLELLARVPFEDKVLIFTESRITATQLYERLSEQLNPRQTGLVTGDMGSKERRELFDRFAPLAQRVAGRPKGGQLQILVATDAGVEGENLQDAAWVINYDLSWTPLRLSQRVGCVDRFTPSKRAVKVRNFYPADGLYEAIVNLWSRLDSRAPQVEIFSASQVAEHERPPAQQVETDASVMEKLYEGELDITQIREHASLSLPPAAMFERLWGADAELLQRARELPDGIQTRIRGERAGLYVLLQHGRETRALFREAGREDWLEAPRDVGHEVLLRHVCVEPGAEIVDPARPLDAAIDGLIRAWLAREGRAVERLRIIAGIEVCDG